MSCVLIEVQVMKRIIFIVSVVFVLLIVGNIKAEISDHVFFVEITQGIDYERSGESYDDEYMFNFQIMTDETVTGVDFHCPSGLGISIPEEEETYDSATGKWTCHKYDSDEDAWEWCYEIENKNLVFSTYGDGTYTITVWYQGGGSEQTEIWFGVPQTAGFLKQPTQIPEPIFPADKTGTDSPVTFSWQPCTDQNAAGIWIWVENEATDEEYDAGTPLGFDQESWGPLTLDNGLYEAGLVFFDGYLGLTNADGIEYLIAKVSESDWKFMVGMDWRTFEVWGGNTDYAGYDEFWEYYQNPAEMTDYVLLGTSNGENLEVCGGYQYYIIRTYDNVGIDAVRGSEGSYLGYWYRWGGFMNPHHALGMTDGIEAVGEDDGWLVFMNPGNWPCFTVITDYAQGCPSADLTGDCFVDIADLAVLASQWLTGDKK